ncbi:MAG: hypothetical protein ABSC94_10495 [Polyangiaceae bacterium]
MTAKSVFRCMSAAAFATLPFLACASSSNSAPGVTNAQGNGRCLDRDANCVANSDCCTLWCVNGVCARKQP